MVVLIILIATIFISASITAIITMHFILSTMIIATIILCFAVIVRFC